MFEFFPHATTSSQSNSHPRQASRPFVTRNPRPGHQCDVQHKCSIAILCTWVLVALWGWLRVGNKGKRFIASR